MLIQSQGFLTFDKEPRICGLCAMSSRADGEEGSIIFWRVLVGPMNHSWGSVGESNSCSKDENLVS